MFILIRLAILAGIIYGGIKVGKYLARKMSKLKQCDYCEGKGYWLGTREKNFCKKCNGTGQLAKG